MLAGLVVVWAVRVALRESNCVAVLYPGVCVRRHEKPCRLLAANAVWSPKSVGSVQPFRPGLSDACTETLATIRIESEQFPADSPVLPGFLHMHVVSSQIYSHLYVDDRYHQSLGQSSSRSRPVAMPRIGHAWVLQTLVCRFPSRLLTRVLGFCASARPFCLPAVGEAEEVRWQPRSKRRSYEAGRQMNAVLELNGARKPQA